MKIRSGFVSNSSSSSFVIRKSALTSDQKNELLEIFLVHNGQYTTNIESDEMTYSGELEAHNAFDEYGNEPLTNIIENLMMRWKIKPLKDYNISYESNCELEE
jgi:hypothetical protein